jgi:ribosomal protein S2
LSVKSASQLILKAAVQCDSFMLMKSGWGMLTNWQTIQLSIKKLKYLETSLTHGLVQEGALLLQ